LFDFFYVGCGKVGKNIGLKFRISICRDTNESLLKSLLQAWTSEPPVHFRSIVFSNWKYLGAANESWRSGPILVVWKWFSDFRYGAVSIIYIYRIKLGLSTLYCSSRRFQVGSPKVAPPDFNLVSVTTFIWNSGCPKERKEYVFIRSREFVPATGSLRIDYAGDHLYCSFRKSLF